MSFDRASYALRVLQNQAAINYSNNTPEGSASLINNTVLPGTNQNFLQSSITDLQNTLSSIGNPDNYNSNRQQNQPSTDQIQARINALQSQQPTIPRAIGITDTIASTPNTTLSLPNLSNISPILLVAGVGLLILILK